MKISSNDLESSAGERRDFSNLCWADNRRLMRTILLFAVVCLAPLSYGQHFDKPTVMNQPYTQLVQEPFFGDYGGHFAPSEPAVAEGGAAPAPAEAQVIAQGNRRYHVTLRARPLSSEAWPLLVELDGHLEGERILFSGSSGGHVWAGGVSKGTLKIQKRGYGGD